MAAVPESDYYCGLFVHEFAHLVHFAIEGQLNSGEYISRFIGAYNAAMNAGLWQGAYASTNFEEYFAENGYVLALGFAAGIVGVVQF